MINRDNWKQTKIYLAYLAEVKQLDEGTLISVRSQLPCNALWYAPFELDGKTLVCDPPADHSRKCHNRFDGGLRSLCELAGVRYRSVHNFRHGFAVYGLKAARDMADMEAVSKNLMHKSLKVTLEVYAVLAEGDVRDRIVKLRQ